MDEEKWQGVTAPHAFFHDHGKVLELLDVIVGRLARANDLIDLVVSNGQAHIGRYI